MRFSIAAAALASAVLGANAANFPVTVGDNGTLAFNPTSITGLNDGDTVSFQFKAKNHSVTQSTFTAPCTASGIDSGFQVTPANATSFATWTLTVENATAPLWFFCAQTSPANHCQAGMVFAINPTADKSWDAFHTNALATNATSSNGQNPSGSAISGTAGATDAALSVSALETAAAFSASGSGTGSATGTAATTSATNNGAAHLGGNAVTLFTLAGLAIGLAL